MFFKCNNDMRQAHIYVQNIKRQTQSKRL